jgi:hypothetical protein
LNATSMWLEDKSILVLWLAVEIELARLKGDAKTEMLHELGCARRREKTDELMLKA